MTNHRDEAALRRLGEQLRRQAYTAPAQAMETHAQMEAAIGTAPADIRFIYHQCAAFQENQAHRYEEALRHYDRAIALLDNKSQAALLVETWADKAAVLLNQRNWAAAQEALDRAKRYLRNVRLSRLQALIACNEGYMHLHLRNNRQALDNLMEAEKILLGLGENLELKDAYTLTLVLGGLGDLHDRLQEKEKSLDAYRRVLPVVEQYQLKPRLAWHYLNAGRAAMAENDRSEARVNLEKAIRYAGPNDEDPKATALANIGILDLSDDRVEQAAARFDEAAAVFQHPSKPSDFDNLAKIEHFRAKLQLRLEQAEKAEAHLLLAFDNGLKGQDRYHQRQVCLMLAQLYSAHEAYKEAYEWQVAATKYTDLNYEQIQDRVRQELEAGHQLERMRQDAQMAQMRVVSLQSRALRAQMNPHFLYNSLNAIQGFITSGRDTDAATYLARFAKFMRKTLDYSDKEVISLEEEIQFITQYLEINRSLRFRDRLQFTIHAPQDADDLLVPTMIVQPFVENAIEHGLRPKQEGTLRIEFKIEDDENALLCLIEDDGVGYNKGREKQAQNPEYQNHRSRGMDITRERLQLLHRRQKTQAGHYFKINDLADLTEGRRNGTLVEVLLPVLTD